MFEHEIEGLATAIRDAVAKYRKTNTIPIRRVVQVRRRDFTLNYEVDFGFANFEPERSEKDIWDWSDQNQFNTSVRDMEEYKALVSALGSNASSVEDFVRAISSASFQGLDDKELTEHVSAFGRELGNQPLPVKVIALIDGLSINESPLVISESLILRQPTPEDRAEYVVLNEYGGYSLPVGAAWFRIVGELVFDALSTGLAQREFLRTLEALRLFRVGGIAANCYTMRSRHNFLHGGTITSGGGPQRSRFSYTLAVSDATRLNRFLGDVMPLLPDPFNPDTGTTETQIAYSRYRDALFHEGPSERTITSAITALEALFLKAEPELTHRLAQRVAVLLRALGLYPDGRVTYENVSKGYKIRSTFIHGGSL